MREELEKAEAAIKGVGEIQELTEIAVRIASYSLRTFRGELLEKALAISKTIVEFEVELNHPS